jgi:OmpA family/PEGA domain
MRTSLFILLTVFALGAALMGPPPAMAQTGEQNGKLKIHVRPKQAYVFVDGKAIRDGSQTIHLSSGNHIVSVRNYGYTAQSQDVEVNPNGTTSVNVSLRPSGGLVSGPFGEIELKGYPRAAVLLGGTTPSDFVGHVDEFDWNWIWQQRLLVTPGTHLVTVKRGGKTLWSGMVTVKAGQRVTVHLGQNGRTDTADWPLGNTIGPLPRFHAGIASATVALAAPTAQLTAQPVQISCGQSSRLNWSSTNAVNTSITSAGTDPNIGLVPADGDRSVAPTHTMTYVLTARGPDGAAQRTATVHVNIMPTAKLSLSPSEVHVHRIGDKVVSEDSSKLEWSTSDADSVRIRPLGQVADGGGEIVKPLPEKTSVGPISEDVNYKLTASSACGGTITRTATLHLVGTNDPLPPVSLASVFYPTDYPRRPFENTALVANQQRQLATLAKGFNAYLKYDPKAKLLLVGHADVRGPKAYNQSLSERRAGSVKDYLISWGVPEGKIETRALGVTQQLNLKKVERLQDEDQQKPDKWMTRHAHTTWLAYNRRVDLILEPQGKQSIQKYPNDAKNVHTLWQSPVPSLGTVEQAEQLSAGQEQAFASGLTN